MSETKTCSKCGDVKAVEMFRKRRTKCRLCEAYEQRVYAKNNPEKVKALRKKYIQKNTAKEKARQKKYREENPEKAKASAKKYREANPGKEKARQKKYHEENPERSKEQHKKAKDELRDSYIKVLLTLQLRCKASELPSELIEVKRKHFQVLQKIKEMTDERQSKNPR